VVVVVVSSQIISDPCGAGVCRGEPLSRCRALMQHEGEASVEAGKVDLAGTELSQGGAMATAESEKRRRGERRQKGRV
jgi:hypothetical protein